MQRIVILGGGTYHAAPEFGADTVRAARSVDTPNSPAMILSNGSMTRASALTRNAAAPSVISEARSV